MNNNGTELCVNAQNAQQGCRAGLRGGELGAMGPWNKREASFSLLCLLYHLNLFDVHVTISIFQKKRVLYFF